MLKIEGDLIKDKTCRLIVIDKSTNEESIKYEITGFAVLAKDSNNIYLHLNGKKMSGIFNDSNTLDKGVFIEVIWDRLPPGKYYIVFESIYCSMLNKMNPLDEMGDFMLPDTSVMIIKP